MIHILFALYLSLNAVPVITLERTQCYGECPVYTISIYEDGKVLYEGREFVKHKGRAEGQITREALEDLIHEFERIDYVKLDDYYTSEGKNCPEWWTDSSSTITSLNWKGKNKKIDHYHGCKGTRVLEQLTALERKIDATVNSAQWVE